MSQLPTLKEELDRKAFETIDWLATSFDQGKLTNAQYAAGLEALFMAVSGLCDDEIVDLITTASGIAGAPLALDKRHFIKGDTLVSLTRAGGQEEYHLAVRKNGVVTSSQVKTFDSAKAAQEAARQCADKLLAMGYAEL